MDDQTPPEVETPKPNSVICLYGLAPMEILEPFAEIEEIMNDVDGSDLIKVTVRHEHPHSSSEMVAPLGFTMVPTPEPKRYYYTQARLRAGMVAWFSDLTAGRKV